MVVWRTVLSIEQNESTIDLSSGRGCMTSFKHQQTETIIKRWVQPQDSPNMTYMW
jgi:hypothetical protein